MKQHLLFYIYSLLNPKLFHMLNGMYLCCKMLLSSKHFKTTVSHHTHSITHVMPGADQATARNVGHSVLPKDTLTLGWLAQMRHLFFRALYANAKQYTLIMTPVSLARSKH